MQKVKFLIIGAGITGLSFANFINDNDILILEKEHKAGGFCRTIYKENFIWDYAGHFFHFRDENIKKIFIQAIGSEQIIMKKKNTKVFYNGQFIDYPFQKNIHQLPQEEFIDCLYDLFNRFEKKSYKSFEEMLYGKYGISITEKFLKPYNEKLYACNLNKLDSNAMGRFFPEADIKEIISNMKFVDDKSYNNMFLYPKKGAFAFIDALLQKIDSQKVVYNQELININIDKKIARTRDIEIQYDYLINTAPFNEIIRYIDEEEYIRNRKNLTYNKVLVINLGFNKKSYIDNIHWIYVSDRKINFYRIGFYDNILDTDKLSMYVEIGYPSESIIDSEKQLKITLQNLRNMKIIDDQKLIAHTSIIMNPAYVHISENGNAYKKTKKKKLEMHNIYSIGRYGDWKYCSTEDSILDAIELAKKLAQ